MADLIKATLPFTKKRIGKHYQWKFELDILFAWCEANGAELFLTYAPYQVAKIIGDGFKIVAYPHKTSACHHHMRLRDEGSKNKRRAEEVMETLDRLDNVRGCTFSRHHNLSRLLK
ncbi:hypothetical protein HB779_17485 [Phyllobacterium sp. 628]|uniref:hypothetical protein n=1 Tax=Phyllobacterium sp. 628 TaxID=2718938 RepID=UPI00166285D4|nr:hypothetical protein [Phyllobacterium sp. 628]QND53480.1 hypothetical protein HB779_17485 [Phyllobacterium sp. 628]